MPIKVCDASFQADVLDSKKPVLVDFWAEWCGPCRMIAPALDELSTELGDKVTIAKINIDENPHVPTKYGVRGIPTMPIKVSDASFQADVLDSKKPVLVDFWAEWCGPCRMIAPALDELSTEMGDKLTIAKINIDENPHVPTKYGDGELVDRKSTRLNSSHLKLSRMPSSA